MAFPINLWWTKPGGSISSETNGYSLIVDRRDPSGEIRFLVNTPPGKWTLTVRTMCSGRRRTAMQAMAAAERAAAALPQPRLTRGASLSMAPIMPWRDGPRLVAVDGRITDLPVEEPESLAN